MKKWQLVDLEEEKVDEEALEEEPPQQEVKEEEEEEEEEEKGECTYTKYPPLPHPEFNHGLGLLDCLAQLRWSTGLASMEWSSLRPSCRLGKELPKNMALRMNINFSLFFYNLPPK
jgi:hypothetical protein